MLLLPFNGHATIFCFLLALFEVNKNMHFNSLIRQTLHWNPFPLKNGASPYISSYWNTGNLITVLPWTAQLSLKGQKLERKGTTRLSIQLSLIPAHAERELGAKSALIATQHKGTFACIKTCIEAGGEWGSICRRGGGKWAPTESWNRASAGEHKDFSPSPHEKLQKLICGLGLRQLCRRMPPDGFFRSLVCWEFLPAEKCSRVVPPLPCSGFLQSSAHPSLLAPHWLQPRLPNTDVSTQKSVPSTRLHSQKQLSPKTTVQPVQLHSWYRKFYEMYFCFL